MNIYLLGDSVFDNGAYVEAGGSLIEILHNEFALEAKLLAVDGHKMEHLSGQVKKIDEAAYGDDCRIFVSVGGNDILPAANELTKRVGSVYEAFSHFHSLKSEFGVRCRLYADIVAKLLKRGAEVGIFTIYEGNFDEDKKKALSVGVSIFNDVLYRTFNEISRTEENFRIYELRDICNEHGDYANPIEPSSAGARKIANVIKSALEG